MTTPLDPAATAALQRAAALSIDFRNQLDDGPQRPRADYHEMLQRFDAPLPGTGASPAAVIAQLADRAAPGLTAMTGRRFFGWVIGGSHPVGVAADWLTSAWGQNAGNHLASPAAAACETVAARWLLELLGLPPEASVGFTTGATMANFVGLAAARGEVLRRVGWDADARGLFGAPPIQVLIGDDAHTTVFSALQYLGLGHERVTRVATGADGAIDAAAFEQALLHCPEGPLIVVLQAGQINTGAFDPFLPLIARARARGAWVHVDGAFGLWARACPAHAAPAEGVQAADSWATDGHKWLQTPYDCGYAIVRDAQAHERAMSVHASYLPDSAGDRNPASLVPELSRRARGFATWALISHLGRDGIAAMVERHGRLARRIADRIARERGAALLNEVVLNQAVLRFGADVGTEAGDRLTRAVIDRVQREGRCFVGGAQWRGRWVMRLSVIGATEEADADLAAEAIAAAWRAERDAALED
ncbi:MAG: aspartate aminotransferase family protein [Burkholderiaceae bacterium]|nr:aspartate aminotransferase family protein [Burkholderiaceae bacterium]